MICVYRGKRISAEEMNSKINEMDESRISKLVNISNYGYIDVENTNCFAHYMNNICRHRANCRPKV